MFFKRKKKTDDSRFRRFAAAANSRLLEWALSYAKPDAGLKSDYVTVTLRARDLAVNNEFVIGFLENAERNIIGAEGFSLQSRSRLHRADIEKFWLDYNSRQTAAVTLNEKQSGHDFDCLILRTLLIDGEVFIHRIFDPESKYSWRYEVLDSLEVDPFYNVSETEDGGRITMGIRFDSRGREVSYFLRHSTEDYYQSGPLTEVPANEILHIYRQQFPNQSRGISSFAGVVLNLGHLDGYKEAELVHARIQACTMGVWEENGRSTGDLMDEVDDKGEFISEIKPGIFPVAPKGYTAKFLQNSSPNSQFASFWKNLLRSISNALGISYNKASGDYESVNYSSLREATLEDRASFQKMQRFFIENWKDFQFTNFISACAMTGLLPLRDLSDMNCHRFFGRRFPWVDPAKEVSAKEKEYDLLLTDPISELEQRGIDPDEMLDRWAEWNNKLKERGIPFMVKPPIEIIEEKEIES